MDFAFVRQKTIPKLKLLAPSPPPPAKEGKKVLCPRSKKMSAEP
jgi:hypothetical protein